MISGDDIVDVISRLLEEKKSFSRQEHQEKSTRYGFFTRPEQPYISGYTTLPRRREFFSEYDLRQCLKRGEKVIRLSRTTIISPLAQEIIEEKGIKIIRE